MDFISKKKRSFIMSKIRSKNTKPEVVLREILRDMGIKYRLDSKLPGRPDIKIVGKKTVIFVDGCFWHGCPKHYKQPTSNIDFWIEKFTKNKARDRRNLKKLKLRGYEVIRIWEHEFEDQFKLHLKIQKRLELVLETEIKAA